MASEDKETRKKYPIDEQHKTPAKTEAAVNFSQNTENPASRSRTNKKQKPIEQESSVTSPQARSNNTVKSKPYFSKEQSFVGYLATILISVFVSILITLLAIPVALRVSPIAFYRGDFLNKRNPKTIIETSENNSLVAAVAKKVKPSVVTISVVQKSTSDFFFPELEENEEAQAAGSGVIYSEDGYIITNNHVVENAKSILVTIGESTDIPGKIIAGDSESDIAVIKVDKNNLPAAEIGSTKKISVGDTAVAIGTPFRFQHTVTSGIISAKHRAFDVPDEKSLTQKTLTDLLQTDAAINPGNSGGALANAKGEIIGINTAIASTSGSSAGIGFAIPIEQAVESAKQLISKGKTSHPYMGVSIRTVTKDVAAERDIPEGAWVLQVMADSPAHKAGIKIGDVITEIGGKRIEEAEELITEIKRGRVGDKLSVTYVRDNKTKEVKVTLAERPSEFSR